MSWEGTVERWALSLILAALLWAAVEAERSDDLTVNVPVVLERVPAGFRALNPPSALRITLSGPRIILARVRFAETVCRLDLAGTGAGTVTFPALEHALSLDRELKVTRVYPAPLKVTLVEERRR